MNVHPTLAKTDQPAMIKLMGMTASAFSDTQVNMSFHSRHGTSKRRSFDVKRRN